MVDVLWCDGAMLCVYMITWYGILWYSTDCTCFFLWHLKEEKRKKEKKEQEKEGKDEKKDKKDKKKEKTVQPEVSNRPERKKNIPLIEVNIFYALYPYVYI